MKTGTGEVPFYDRTDAGRKLATLLDRFAGEDTIVLALPRGGVPVAFEIARRLAAPLDVIVARKLGAPEQPGLGIGALAPGGEIVVDRYAVNVLGITDEQLSRVVRDETAEMERRQRLYRGDRPMPDLTNRTVILVDDGLATGVTARAAIKSIRRHQPRRVILAVPVCAPETASALSSVVDDLICVACPPQFRAVGFWYQDFGQTSDEEVIHLLERARPAGAAGENAR